MVQRSVETAFDTTLVQLITHFTDLHGHCLTAKDDVLDKIGSSEHDMLVTGCSALTEVRILLDIVSQEEKKNMIAILFDGILKFFEIFNNAISAYAGKWIAAVCPENVEVIKNLSWCPTYCLALVRIGRHLEVKGIAQLYQVASDFLGGTNGKTLELLQQESRAAAQRAMDHLVFTEGSRLSHLLRNSVETKDWKESVAPSVPRMVCGLILKEIHQFDNIVSKILGDPRRPRADRRNRIRKNIEVQLMLAKSVQTFTTIPFNRNGALFGLLKIVVKAYALYVREEIFVEAGIQQVQLDVAFLNDMFRDFVELDDVNMLDGMCNEIITAAQQRIQGESGGNLIEDVVVENIVEEYKSKFEY